jgi:hypothetical protein
VRAALLALALAVAPRPAPACEGDAEALRARLDRAARRASRWNLTWRLAFTATAAGSLALAVADPFPELRDGLAVSAGKAAVGALARWILPLRIDVPAPRADACADVAALRAALADAARRQRRLFIVGHAGALAVNLAGAGILWARGEPGQAAVSVAVGYPIALLANYTMPRDEWRAWRVEVAARGDGWLVTLGGTL